ncbi:MAG: 3-methyl-2-oxobutanoate hydroxymethyltransferase [Elusimicrobiota bacterium]
MDKKTITIIKDMKKNGERIVALTCYSYSVARLMNKSDIDIILVGDSVGMVELGYENTIPVTPEEMLHHIKAVKRSQPSALLVADMPFMSYNISDKETLRMAGRFLKEGGAEAVKLEGGKTVSSIIKLLVDNNIPVMGHIGLTPQSIHRMGGYKVQGRSEQEAGMLKEDARLLDEAGVFSIVLEGVPAMLARDISASVSVPTIGIGAGIHCDRQILVVNDMLGLDMDMKLKFVRRYADIGKDILTAFDRYAAEVRAGKFPAEEESY